MRKQEELLDLVEEPVRKVIRQKVLELHWDPDPTNRNKKVEFGYPHKLYIPQNIPDELVAMEVRHLLREVIFSLVNLKCDNNPSCEHRYIAQEIVANKFQTEEDELAYIEAEIPNITANHPAIQDMYADTRIPVEYLDRFPAEELHSAICTEQEKKKGGGRGQGDEDEQEGEGIGGSGGGSPQGNCRTQQANAGKPMSGEAKAAAYLLGTMLANSDYGDQDISHAMSGGLGSAENIWD